MGKAKQGSKAAKTEQKVPRKKSGQTSLPWSSWSLAEYGLRVETVKADGNCFFRAVAAQLEGASGDHMRYRQDTVSFMRQHRDDFEPFMEDGEDFERYCSRMAQDGTWAGQQEQVALACHYGIMIRVYQADQPAWTIKPDMVPEDAPTIHLSYHDGEHYNSVRLARDTGTGPPEPVTLQKRQASAKDWSSFGPAQIELVMQGTGCYDDKQAVQRALQDAKGNADEAIELLIERLAAQAVQEEGEHKAHPAAQARPAAQAEMAAVASSAETPAASHERSKDAGESDAQAAAPEQHSCKSLKPDEHSLSSESHVCKEVVPHTANEAATEQERDTGPAVAKLEGCLEIENSMSCMKVGKDSRSCGSTDQQDTDRGKRDALQHKESKVASKQEKKPARNRPCPCGSGRRYKECCGPVQAAQKRRQTNGLQPPEQLEGHGHVMAELYV